MLTEELLRDLFSSKFWYRWYVQLCLYGDRHLHKNNEKQLWLHNQSDLRFYRVKGSLQNSNTFGKAFDCPFINEYSPQVKCEVWWWHRTLTADWALHEGGWTTQLLLSNSRNIKRDKKKTNKYGQPCYWTICSHKIFKRFHDECFIHTWMNFSCVCHLNIALVYLFVTPFKLLNFYIALHFLK